MTKDTLVFGGLAGIAGNIVKETITWGLYFSGIVKYTFDHFCAGIVVNPGAYIKDPLSIVVGMLIDFTIAVVFGVVIHFIMKKTGNNHWLLKGLVFGMIVYLLCYGVLRPVISIKIESPPFIALLYMGANFAYGVTTGWFLKKYGTYNGLRAGARARR